MHTAVTPDGIAQGETALLLGKGEMFGQHHTVIRLFHGHGFQLRTLARMLPDATTLQRAVGDIIVGKRSPEIGL